MNDDDNDDDEEEKKEGIKRKKETFTLFLNQMSKADMSRVESWVVVAPFSFLPSTFTAR